MRGLVPPDLDLIKQEKQVCGPIDRIEPVICAGRTEGATLSAQQVDISESRKILCEILAGVRIAGGNTTACTILS